MNLIVYEYNFNPARRSFIKHAPATSTTRFLRLTKILQLVYSDILQYCVLVVGLTTHALYGLLDSRVQDPLHVVQLIFFFYFFIEPILRIYLTGLINFWYVPHDVFQESNNRYNLILSAMAATIFITTISTGSFQSAAPRIILFLPMLRIFCAIKWMRLRFLGVIRILFKISLITIFGILMFYFYALCGIFLYAGAFQDFSEYNKSFNVFNFNSLGDALLTLFVCFMSGLIRPITFAAIDTGEVFYTFVYFFFFTLVFRLIFMKTLVAILLDSHRRIETIIGKSSDGVISTFEFWRSMKDEGRLEEGRLVKIRVSTGEHVIGGDGTSACTSSRVVLSECRFLYY